MNASSYCLQYSPKPTAGMKQNKAVRQLLYAESNVLEWLYCIEKATLQNLEQGTSMGEPL
jgi:hypothetical protein